MTNNFECRGSSFFIAEQNNYKLTTMSALTTAPARAPSSMTYVVVMGSLPDSDAYDPLYIEPYCVCNTESEAYLFAVEAYLTEFMRNTTPREFRLALQKHHDDFREGMKTRERPTDEELAKCIDVALEQWLQTFAILLSLPDSDTIVPAVQKIDATAMAKLLDDLHEGNLQKPAYQMLEEMVGGTMCSKFVDIQSVPHRRWRPRTASL